MNNLTNKKVLLSRLQIMAVVGCVLLSTFDAPAQAVNYQFSRVSSSDSIQLGKISAITQDKRGFIWLVDQNNACLIKYDGYKMVRYKHDIEDSNSIEKGDLEAAYADDRGTVWVGVDNGVDQFDPATGIFKHYLLKDPKADKEHVGRIWSILRDRQGIVWVGTPNGLFQLDPTSNKVTHYLHDSSKAASLSSNAIYKIYQDRQGDIWIGTGFPFNFDSDGGLNKLDRKSGTFTRFIADSANPQALINNKVSAIFEDSKGNFWVGTGNDGLHIMNRKMGIFQRFRYDPAHPEKLSRPVVRNHNFADYIPFICEDQSGTIWIGTSFSGLNAYDPVSQKITHYESKSGLPGFGFFTAFISKDGLLWIANQWNVEDFQLIRFDPFAKPVSYHAFGSSIGSYFEDKKGNIWIGTFGDSLFYKLSQGKKDSQQLFHLPNNLSRFPVGNAINDIIEYKNEMWLATGDGLMKFDPGENKFTRIPHDPENHLPFKNFIVDILVDSRDRMWIATAGGLTMNEQNGQVSHFLNNPKDSSSPHSDAYTSIEEDHSGNIWVGHYESKGIDRWTNKNGGFKNYLGFLKINSLLVDSHGVIWVATSSGIFTYDGKLDKFTQFRDPATEIEKLEINSFIEDDKKNLWVSSPSNIFRINPARTEVISFGKRFGIQPYSMAGGAFKSSKGEVFFSAREGYYSFFPTDLEPNPTAPQIVITDFSVNNKIIKPAKDGILTTPIDESTSLKLEYDQNNISLGFVGIHFSNPGGNRNFYKLENYDNDWRMAGSENTASYFQVPNGKYIFRIKSISSTGSVSEKAINIVIYPPWWRTWWAYTLYALIFLFNIYAIYRDQRRKIIRAERERTQQTELAQAREIEKAYKELQTTQAQLIQSEKMASLGELTAGIAHEIQNPLNFVNNFAEVNMELIGEMKDALQKGDTGEANEVADDIFKNLEKISHHGKRADGIVKGMLQHSRKSSGLKEPTDINALADEYLRLSYHGLRAKDKSFNAVFHTHLDPSVGNINVVPQDIGRVLLNIYNNAFYAVQEKKKLTETEYEPTVWVTTKKIGDRVEILIRDNGLGIPPKVADKIFQPFFTTKPTGEGTGLGLSMSYDIVTKVHGGTLRLETSEGEGTTFIVSLPI